MPAHPETSLLDFQRETAALIHLAELIDADRDESEQVRALALAVPQVHERVLEEVLRCWEAAVSPEAGLAK